MYCDNNHNFCLTNFFYILIYSFGVLVLNEIILRLYYESLIKDFMDRHPQQIKRERQDKKKHLLNVARASDTKTIIKNTLEENDISKAKVLYKKAVSTIDKMVNKGHLKKNTAARRKSRLTRHINSLSS